MAKKPARRGGARKRDGARKAKPAKRVTGPNGPAFHAVTIHLTVGDAARAIAWYKDVFDAKELARIPAPGGKLMHAELLVGDSRIMLADAFPGSDTKPPPELGGTTATLHVHHPEADDLFDRAVRAGARVVMAMEDQFWGDRYGKLVDPFGHSWSLGHPAKMSRAEREQKEREAMQALAGGRRPSSS